MTDTESDIDFNAPIGAWPITAKTDVFDAAICIGSWLVTQLEALFPGRVSAMPADSAYVPRAPGRTTFIPVDETTHVRDIGSDILPAVAREVVDQLEGAGMTVANENWVVSFDWAGYGLFDDSSLVVQGFRFDSIVEVCIEPTD